jgi:hypothetical protein
MTSAQAARARLEGGQRIYAHKQTSEREECENRFSFLLAMRRGKIPETIRMGLADRLRKHAALEWARECRGVEVRFRGVYAYVDAYSSRRDYMPGMTEEEKARLDAIPLHLCRLEYFGRKDEWGFAFYKYSDEKYEVSFLPSISWTGTPEECFDCAASVYLSGSVEEYVRRIRGAIEAGREKPLPE